jgi:hypothetical protein
LVSEDHKDLAATVEFSGDEFIRLRTELHREWLRESEKTKRLSLALAAVLVLAAFGAMLFAPAGREVLSYWAGGALLVSAAGAAGYKRVWGRTALGSMGGDQAGRAPTDPTAEPGAPPDRGRR